MQEKQRSEAYRAYVTDSLFFLQHVLAGLEDDENRQIFKVRLSDILDNPEKEKEAQQDPEEIKNRIIEKSKRIAGE